MSNYCVIFAIGNGGVRAVPVNAVTEKQAVHRARRVDTGCKGCFIVNVHKQEVRVK